MFFLLFPQGTSFSSRVQPQGHLYVPIGNACFVVSGNPLPTGTQHVHVRNTSIPAHSVLFSLSKIPLQDCILVDTWLNIILAGWKESKNNFVPRLQMVWKIACQRLGKPESALRRAPWTARAAVIRRGWRIHWLYIIPSEEGFFVLFCFKCKMLSISRNTALLFWWCSSVMTSIKAFLKVPPCQPR